MNADKPLLGLEPGSLLAGAHVVEVTRGNDAALLTVELASGSQVTFALGDAAPKGPFRSCPELSYRSTDVPFAELAPAGQALADWIVGAAGKPVGEHVREWLERTTNLDSAFATLVGHPERSLRVADWLDAEVLDARPCTLPWTRLELGFGGQVGPCCSDFQAAPRRAQGSLLQLWQADVLRAFRRALSTSAPPVTCAASCPRLIGRSDALDRLQLRGGPAAFVKNQRLALDAIVAGEETPLGTPLELLFSTTSYCNYDCLMCHFGEEGTLDDELPEAFYESLKGLLPGLARLEALGGEPLASAVFRAFLAGPILRDHPHVRVALTTNGSYLTPRELERLADVRFEHITVSLNAATAETYERVNRGLPLSRVRENLDALLSQRARAQNPESVSYSMVILRDNLHEIAAFAALSQRDGVGVRFMLPMHDRNGQSFLSDASLMRDVELRLRDVAARLDEQGSVRDARRARGEADVLSDRLARGVLKPLPDGDLIELRRR